MALVDQTPFCPVNQKKMISLVKINGVPILINPELIETVEKHNDTVINLINSNKIIVKNSPEEIREKVIQYRVEIEEKIRLKKISG